MKPERNALRRLRLLALVEGTSLLLLVGVAVPLKHVFHVPVAVKVVGPLHGLAFVAYVVSVVDALGTRQLEARRAGLALLAAMIPGGSFLFARAIARLAAQQVSAAAAAADDQGDVRGPGPARDHVAKALVAKDVDERA